jgi:hypothetical protein
VKSAYIKINKFKANTITPARSMFSSDEDALIPGAAKQQTN